MIVYCISFWSLSFRFMKFIEAQFNLLSAISDNTKRHWRLKEGKVENNFRAKNEEGNLSIASPNKTLLFRDLKLYFPREIRFGRCVQSFPFLFRRENENQYMRLKTKEIYCMCVRVTLESLRASYFWTTQILKLYLQSSFRIGNREILGMKWAFGDTLCNFHCMMRTLLS